MLRICDFLNLSIENFNYCYLNARKTEYLYEQREGFIEKYRPSQGLK